MTERLRPPPYNPIYGGGHEQSSHGNASHFKEQSHHSVNQQGPPPPPQRLYRSLPRRIHRPTCSDLPPSYESHLPQNGDLPYHQRIGFEAVASSSRRQEKGRIRLPMTQTDLNACYLAASATCPSDFQSAFPGAPSSPMGPASGPAMDRGFDGGLVTPQRSVSASRLHVPLSPSRSNATNNSQVSSPINFSPMGCPASSNFPGSPISLGAEASPLVLPAGTKATSLVLQSTVRSAHLLQTVKHISVSSQNELLAIDPVSMLVVIYSLNDNSFKYSFKIVGVQGGCFLTDDTLALGTHRGVRLVRSNGQPIKELLVGSVLSTRCLSVGFVAVQQKNLLIYRSRDSPDATSISKLYKKSGLIRRSKALINVTDVAVTTRHMLVILDMGAKCLYLANSSGKILSKVEPAMLQCGALASRAYVSVDRFDNIFVSDIGNKRLIQFLPSGIFLHTLISFQTQSVRSSFRNLAQSCRDIAVFGACMTQDDRLIVVVSDELTTSELRIYTVRHAV